MRIPPRRAFATALILLAMILASADWATGQIIPQSRRTDWTYAGVPGGIPSRTNICATFSPGATVAQVNAALASCSANGGGVVKLNAGTYTFNNPGVRVAYSNVTLRGAGADRTTIVGYDAIWLGAGSPTQLNRAITGGGAKGSRTFTVASTTGLSVGQMIQLSRADDPDFVFYGGASGSGRMLTQVNVITDITGTNVTVRNPLFIDYTGGSPTIWASFYAIQRSGVEDLKIDHSTTDANSHGGNFNWTYCDSCWVKGVESYKARGFHFQIYGTVNCEFRDGYIHEAFTAGPNNGGLVPYGQSGQTITYGDNSHGKIENLIFDELFPAIEFSHSSSAFYIGYNYIYATGDHWPSWAFDDGHGPHDMMNLYEGNVGGTFGSDGYSGSSSHGTVLRNFFTGYDGRGGSSGGIANPVRLLRLSYYYNLIGNVLGSPGLGSTRYAETLENTGGLPPTAIYCLGYPNMGNWSWTDMTSNPVPGITYPDAKVASTLLRWGNYDYFNRATRWESSEVPAGVSVPGDHVIPTSYYYTSRPNWFPTGVAWPPIGPDVTGGNGGGNGSPDTSGHVNKIPAQLCWESRGLVTNGSFNAAACYPAPPATPTGLKVIR